MLMFQTFFFCQFDVNSLAAQRVSHLEAHVGSGETIIIDYNRIIIAKIIDYFEK